MWWAGDQSEQTVGKVGASVIAHSVFLATAASGYPEVWTFDNPSSLSACLVVTYVLVYGRR